MMSRIAVITWGVKLPNETKGYTRFRSIAEVLSAAGHEVDLITSSFQHWEKSIRDVKNFKLTDGGQTPSYNVVFIPEPGYQRNVSALRLASHRVAAQNLRSYLDHTDKYDLILCEIPPNNIALVATQHANLHSIPIVIDVNDLWPEAMRMVIDIPLVSSLLFYPLQKQAKEVYRRANAVLGTSQTYTNYPFKYRKDKSIPTATVYVGNDLELFDRYAAGQLVDEVGSDPNLGAEQSLGSDPKLPVKLRNYFWVTYAGTLGKSYDIANLIEAVALLIQSDETIKDRLHLYLLGDGPDRAELERRVKKLPSSVAAHIHILGYMDYPQMCAYLVNSDVLVNSLAAKAPQSIPNKIADYLAAGKPMINTGSDAELQNMIGEQEIGMSVAPGDTAALSTAIRIVMSQQDELQDGAKPNDYAKMCANARKLAESSFDRRKSYPAIEQLCADLLKSR